MNIAIIGSGGREHALCKKIRDSKLIKQIICIPGNAGTSKLAKNIEADILNFKKLFKIFKFHKVDLVVVGPEEPLVKGIVDYFKKKKIKVFGPCKYAAKLEGSKAFMKELCKKNNIPTANFKICKSITQVKSFLNTNSFPIVVKADGLAAGKGVFICRNKGKVIKLATEIFKGKFKSSQKLVLEEFIEGEEASYFLIVDENNFVNFGTAQDHKRVGENDTGPNTGGMGAYSPAPIINKELEKKIINKIVNPTLNALKKLGKPYTGFLYVGLMIKKNEPYLIEYNVRMGDPECQTILPKLNTDFGEIINSCCNGKLNENEINWNNKKSLCVVLCSKGYPETYKKNVEIKNIDKIQLNADDHLFHAGTIKKDDVALAVGGRVLNFVSLSDSFEKPRNRIHELLNNLNWSDGFFRKDIGYKVIKK